MKHGYIGKISSGKSFRYLTLFEQKGILLDNVVINLSFDEVVASLDDGDTVVVCSYIGLFASLGTYLTKVMRCWKKG